MEVLLGSPALGSLIREGKTHQIANIIAMGKKQGMIAMDDALFNMLSMDKVDPDAAYEKAIEKKVVRKRIKDELGIVVEAGDERCMHATRIAKTKVSAGDCDCVALRVDDGGRDRVERGRLEREGRVVCADAVDLKGEGEAPPDARRHAEDDLLVVVP